MRFHLLRLAALATLAACTTAPVAQIPEPLPEALEWARPASRGAFLGLKTQENDSGSLDALFFDPGVRVARVVENSPAAAAGFLVGDIVLGLGEAEVNDPAALESLIAAAGADAQVSLKVRRDDTVLEVPVVLRSAGPESSPPQVLYLADATRSRAGWVTARGGALLVSRAEGSPMADAGLAVGDVVTAIEGRDVHSARALVRELERFENGTRVSMSVERDGALREVHADLQAAPRKLTRLSVPILFTYRADAEGEEAGFVLLDLYFISLFRYTRYGAEREYRLLRWINYSSGVGELAE